MCYADGHVDRGLAARVMGYPAFSEVILEQQLSPRAVAAMLRMSATKDGTAAAITILTAGTARHAADPNGWDGETERLLALDAVHTDATGVKQAASRAAKIVAEHWQEIAAERLGSISQKNG